MRNASVFLLVMAAPILAGCVETPVSGTPPTGTEPPSNVIPWGITNCRFIIAVIRPAVETVRPFLPPGFEPAVGDGLPLPVEAPVQGVAGGIEAFACESGAGLDGNVTPMAYGSFYFVVNPPDEYETGRTPYGYYVKHDVLVPDEPRRQRLASAGAPVLDGDVVVQDSAAGRNAVMTLDGIGTVRYTATAPQPGNAYAFGFREFTPTSSGGIVLWDGWAATPGTFSGRGVLEVPAGSTLERLAGGARVELPMFWGTYTFSNATTTLP